MTAIWISGALLVCALVTFAHARTRYKAAARKEADADATYLDARDLHAEARGTFERARAIHQQALDKKVEGLH